jgi:hypothetical protein
LLFKRIFFPPFNVHWNNQDRKKIIFPISLKKKKKKNQKNEQGDDFDGNVCLVATEADGTMQAMKRVPGFPLGMSVFPTKDAVSMKTCFSAVLESA